MFLKEFSTSSSKKIDKINKLLKEQYSMTLGVVSKKQLLKLNETANSALLQIRGSKKKFHLDPDYAKFLGLRDLTETMLNESMYVESPAYESMCNEIRQRIREYMDEGCSMDEACGMCMRDCRKDSRFNWPDSVLMPLIQKEAEGYVAECSESKEQMDLMAGEVALEDQMNLALESGDVEGARTLMAQIRQQRLGEAKAKPDYLDLDKDGNKKEPMKKAAKDAKKKKNESMFDDIINDILNEQVDVEQAEVVMAVRALADDVQDQIERLGRMVNEDVPAIADQMRAEMGAQTAQQFVDQMNATLVGHLEATRAAKAAMDQQIAGLTGEQQTDLSGGLGGGDIGGMEEPGLGGDDTAMAPAEEPGIEPEVSDEIAAGEPMGRAEI